MLPNAACDVTDHLWLIAMSVMPGRVGSRFALVGFLTVATVVVIRTRASSKMQVVSMPTPLGDVSTEVHNSEGKTTIVAVHGFNSALTGEWGVVAAHLASHGYRVLMPNLHSNPATKPGTISHDGFERVMLALADRSAPLTLADGSTPLIWMGKSWGGANVATFAARHPKAVAKLVLTAPALGRSEIADVCAQLNAAGAPMLLLWAEDDPVVPFGNSKVWSSTCSRVQLHSEPTGGHRILPGYATAVADFVKGARR